MKEPEIIVANQTYGYGNIPYASSGDNALDSVSCECAGGLANVRAVTSWCIPGWNHLKRQDEASAGTQLLMSWSAEPVSSWRRQYPPESSGMCAGGTPWRIGDGTAAKDWKANRDGPMTISSVPIKETPEMEHIWVMGPAHVVIVVVKPVITSRTSEGPLDSCGRPQQDWSGILPFGAIRFRLHRWVAVLNISRPQKHLVQFFPYPVGDGEVCIKPQGKGAHERQRFQPDRGNPAVRDDRGLGGNGCVVIFQPVGGMPRVCNGM